ncbi:MAG: hypothetical protein KDB88_03380 [Flavobacteriales bacterium]|nr:hypothetical protein [Flavobacteriales bacterium]
MLLVAMLAAAHTFAQEHVDPVDRALHGAGKANTVAGVVGIILAGLFIWLFSQDRRLTRLERRNENEG